VVWDEGEAGLGLRVQSGKKSWIVRYRVAGAQRQKSTSGNLSLKKAWAWAAEIRTGATRGADIVAEGRAAAEGARREAEAARAKSLGKIIEKYLVDAEKRLRPAEAAVSAARAAYPQAFVLARAHDDDRRPKLEQLGASVVLTETLELSLGLAGAALLQLDVPEEVASEALASGRRQSADPTAGHQKS
jgi:Arm DNA-binding domain